MYILLKFKKRWARKVMYVKQKFKLQAKIQLNLL